MLAAGYGTRLRPLTDRIPKCLVPIGGKPLLEWWLELLQQHGVTQVLVNTHYLAEQVRGFIQAYNARHTGVSVTEFYEPELLGSGGTVWANRAFVAGENKFYICYADNLTDMDLTALRAVHAQSGAPLTMALFRSPRPKACGIAQMDATGRIVKFEEKPAQPRGNLANAGVYVAGQGLFDCFPEQAFLDLGKDVLPRLVGRMAGWETADYLIDIGTPENYEKAKREWKR